MTNESSDSNSSPKASSGWRRTITFCLACIFLVVWFGALDEREFFNPDEGRYAEIPREMVASGDWVTPRLNGFKYFEKPVLQYWITAVSYLALGQEEFVARLWPALSGFLTLLLVYYMGRRLAGVRAGVLAAAVLATTFQFFVFSQLLTLDMGLSFFLTAALYGFLVSQDFRAAPVQQRNGAILMWVAMALGVLSKGLVGVVLPALVLVVYIVMERDWKLLGRLHWAIGVPVFLAIALPWFIWVQLRNPEFFQFFFIREHFGRYALHEHHRAGAWYYFPAVLLIGSLPWSFMYI
ncbi:MAG: glycosyltransferase family 39 protein, partial [Burkholderiales bacterium]